MACRDRADSSRAAKAAHSLARVLLGVAVAATLLPGVAYPRMYQWVNPQTGAVQLSGIPPAWYRSPGGGPRVRVFDDGNLVDDTAIALPRAQAKELRDAAFEEHEQRQRAEALRRLERTALMEQRRLDEAQRLQRQEAEIARREAAGEREGSAASRALGVTEERPQISDEELERLKRLLGEFDLRGGALGAQ